MDLRARVVYKNREMQTVGEYDYTLRDYAEMLSLDLKRIITDVEDLVYTLNGNQSKDDWTNEELALFAKIKHKVLDKAGEISRICECIYDPEEQ